MKLQKYIKSENVKLIAILIILLAVFSLIPITRFLTNGTLIGENSYYITRLADTILKSKSLIVLDELSFDNGPFLTEIGTPLFIAIFSFIFRTNVEVSCIILSILLGILSILIFHSILRNLNFSKRFSIIASILLAISPAFLFLITICNSHLMAAFIALLVFYLILTNKNKLAYLLLITIPFFNILDSIMIFLLLFIYHLYKKQNIKKFLFAILISALLIVLYYLPLLYYFDSTILTNIKVTTTFNLISNLGGELGISFFAIVLAIIGLTFSWKQKKKIWPTYFILFFLLILALYYESALIYLNLFIPVFACAGLLGLIKIKWESKLVKNSTILILIIGFILSTSSTIDGLIKSEPNKAIQDSLEFLKFNSENDAIVLSHTSNAAWITSFAERKVLLSNNILFNHDMKTRFKLANNLFEGINDEDTKELLTIYNIKYIWIDEAMKTGEVWQREEQGLLFLLKYSTNFKNIYNNHNIEIWEVK